MLFEIAIIKKPTKKETEETGAVETLVFGPKPVMAKDAQSAAIQAVMKEKLDIDLDKCEVLVRPFAEP